MEEKKLTDEEIVKALEMDCLCVVYRNGCENCPLFDEDCSFLPNAIKDLIHRLQSENKSLREIAIGATETQGLNIELLQKNAEQKAEIERLTRELDDTISMNEMYVEKVRQNAELQKQVDELKETNRKLFEYGASKIVECEQAVKDTVKEIWLKAKSLEEEENDYDFPLYTFGLWLNRRFGVEVE